MVKSGKLARVTWLLFIFISTNSYKEEENPPTLFCLDLGGYISPVEKQDSWTQPFHTC